MRRSFFADFVAGEPRALALLPGDFRSAAERRARVRARLGGIRPELAERVRAQDALLPASAARARNLDLLAGGGAVAVLTGQQVGLFLGPLYTFYKAASAIAVARALAAETGAPVVPVFWLQTDDHDFAEIDHCHLPGSPPVRIALPPGPAAVSRVSVAHRRLGPEVSEAIAAAAQALEGPAAGATLDLLRRHYLPGHTIGRAFAGMIAEIFADEGLIVFDPREPGVARLLAPSYRRALTDAASISALLSARGEALAAAGYREQVRVRPGSPLCFFHPEGPEGPRFRLAATGAGWRIAGGSTGGSTGGAGRERGALTAERLAATLEEEPLRFSSSALLRPVLQDTIFPTVAYVGGPAEVAYFSQLAPLYAHFEVPMPLIVPRARFRVVDEKTRSLLEKVGLTAAEAERPPGVLLALAGARAEGSLPAPDDLRAEVLDGVLGRLEVLERAARAVDPTLTRPAEKTRATVQAAITRLLERYAAARGRRDAVLLERLARLGAALFPGGAPQERVLGLPGFAARFGVERFKAAVFARLDAFRAEVREVTP